MLTVTDPTTIAFKFWDENPTDNPNLLNGFNGTFAFSDHLLIPEGLTEFLLEYFRPKLKEGRGKSGHIDQSDLEEINTLLNELWEGPGSMSKIIRMMYMLKDNRLLETPLTSSDTIKGFEYNLN